MTTRPLEEPPWLSAVQYRRPAPAPAALIFTSAGLGEIAVVSLGERDVLRQRDDPGALRYGSFRWGAALGGALVSFLPLMGLSLAVTSGGRPAVMGPSAAAGPVFAKSQGLGECEVRRVTIAFDWRARPQLQQSLDQIAATVDMGTPRGLWQGADLARKLLLQWLQSARAACFVSLRGSAAAAQMLFDRTCDELNRRYDQGTISNQRRNEPPEVRARREEGEGLVVVSIVVGVNGNLPPLPDWPTIESVAQALMTLVPATPDALAALEVVWSPSIDQDRLSSAEMAVLYPELVSLRGAEPLGRMVCRACKTVYARELGRCPSCGSADATPSPLSAQQAMAVSSSHTIECPYCRRPTPAYEVQCQHCGGRVRS